MNELNNLLKVSALFCAVALGGCVGSPLASLTEQDNTVPTVSFVLFDENSSELTDEGRKLVRDAAKYAKRFDNVRVAVAGHTTDAEFATDPELDKKRIEAGVQAFEKFGVERSRLVLIERDNQEKVDATNPESPANRRIDLLFVISEGANANS